MKSIQHKTHRNNRYCTINVTCVEDPNVSGLAKAIHLYAMSRPADWDLHTEDIMNRFKEGRDSIYKAMQNLVDNKYLVRRCGSEQEHTDKGHFKPTELHWYEEPQNSTVQQSSPRPEIPYTATPDTVSPDTAAPHTVKQTHSNNHNSINQNTIDQGTNDQDTKGSQPDGCPWCAKPKTAKSGTHYLLQQCHDIYRSVKGECLVIIAARDGKRLSDLLKQGKPEAEILERYWVYLNTDDKFYARRGWDIPMFVQNYNGMKAHKSATDNALELIAELEAHDANNG
ncbi:MAG: hypothetical protein M1356_09230 [Gammaproteobacteria bacterium]|nr:hypothetical protein [Gammaproteobacteria bacterium]